MDKTKQFKVGDRVRCIAPFAGCSHLIGKTGTIVDIDKSWYNSIGVAFDEPFVGGHTCNNHCPGRCGRYGHASALELITAFITADEIDIKMAFEEIFDDG